MEHLLGSMAHIKTVNQRGPPDIDLCPETSQNISHERFEITHEIVKKAGDACCPGLGTAIPFIDLLSGVGTGVLAAWLYDIMKDSSVLPKIQQEPVNEDYYDIYYKLSNITPPPTRSSGALGEWVYDQLESENIQLIVDDHVIELEKEEIQNCLEQYIENKQKIEENS